MFVVGAIAGVVGTGLEQPEDYDYFVESADFSSLGPRYEEIEKKKSELAKQIGHKRSEAVSLHHEIKALYEKELKMLEEDYRHEGKEGKTILTCRKKVLDIRRDQLLHESKILQRQLDAIKKELEAMKASDKNE